jgi:hypothetical protein
MDALHFRGQANAQADRLDVEINTGALLAPATSATVPQSAPQHNPAAPA